MTTGIYEVLNLANGKRYIGSAICIENRFSTHRQQLRGGKHHSAALQHAWNKHGEGTFEFRVIQPCAKEQLLFQEQRAIHGFRPDYNICKVAGSPTGTKHTPEARAKMAAVQKGKKKSLETRARMSASQRGKRVSLETRAKMAAAHAGKKCAPETRAKLSAALAGVPWSPAYRAAYEKRKEKLC